MQKKQHDSVNYVSRWIDPFWSAIDNDNGDGDYYNDHNDNDDQNYSNIDRDNFDDIIDDEDDNNTDDNNNEIEDNIRMMMKMMTGDEYVDDTDVCFVQGFI